MSEEQQQAVERVWYQESRTINLGRFNSIKIEAGYATTRHPDEQVSDAIRRASIPVIKQLGARERRVRNR